MVKGNHGRNDTLRTPQQKHQSRVKNSQNKGAPSALAGKKTGHVQGSRTGREEHSPRMIQALLSLALPFFPLFFFAFWFCLLIFFSQLLLLSYLPYLFPNSLFFSFFSFSLFPHSLHTFFYSTLTKLERNYKGREVLTDS